MNQIFGIVIPTYKRSDGSTPELLKRSIASVFNQFYQNFILVVVGDNYTDHGEFSEIRDSLIKDYPKVIGEWYFMNLRVSHERDTMGLTGQELWHCGGAQANNRGIECLIKDGRSTHYCHLDDDDLWYPNHLEILTRGYNSHPDCKVCFTNAKYMENRVLPRFGRTSTNEADLSYKESEECLLVPTDTCHSAVSWDLNRFRALRYNSCPDEPADGNIYKRMSNIFLSGGMTSVHCNLITVEHISERRMV